jgi:CPA1 family monovalent cation:H+ antiporter
VEGTTRTIGNLEVGIGVVLGMLVVVIALARVAQRWGLPRSIVFVVAGAGLAVATALVPGIPFIRVSPDVVFYVLLPPLIVSAAYDTPVAFLRKNVGAVALLAFALVLVSTAVVAWLVRLVVPDLSWPLAIALGSIVSPPDPVAASEIAASLGLPNRLVVILSGEGLVNDATALSTYRIALAAVAGSFSLAHAALDFARIATTGVLVGLALGWITRRVLTAIDDAVLETAITLLVPFSVYLLAESVQGSGILAAVTAGFLLRHRAHELGGPSTRVSGQAVWGTLVFLVNSLAFLFMGYEVGAIFAHGVPPGFWRASALVCAGLVVTRMLWMLVVPWLTRTAGHEPGPLSHRIVAGWAGMRGVVSLAAALSLPLGIGSRRDLLVAITFAVIVITLVVQGLSLPALIRWLDVAEAGAAEREERRARREAARTALDRLDRVAAEHGLSEAAHRRLERVYMRQARDDDERETTEREAFAAAQEHLLEVEREVVQKLRDEGEIGDEVSRRLEYEINVRQIPPVR